MEKDLCPLASGHKCNIPIYRRLVLAGYGCHQNGRCMVAFFPKLNALVSRGIGLESTSSVVKKEPTEVEVIRVGLEISHRLRRDGAVSP